MSSDYDGCPAKPLVERNRQETKRVEKRLIAEVSDLEKKELESKNMINQVIQQVKLFIQETRTHKKTQNGHIRKTKEAIIVTNEELERFSVILTGPDDKPQLGLVSQMQKLSADLAKTTTGNKLNSALILVLIAKVFGVTDVMVEFLKGIAALWSI